MKRKSKYDCTEVAGYWSRRLQETDPLSAVLTFNAPALINEAYHEWEIGSLKAALGCLGKSEKPLRGKAALDIACGIGRVTRHLAELGARTSAIDLSPAMIGAAKRRCAGLSVDFVNAAADNLPFDNSSFDIITCFGLLEHLPSRPRANCVAEIIRLLRRSGRALVVVNNIECIFFEKRSAGRTRRGYHVELVGLDWLGKAARAGDAEIRILAANPGYAIAHYQIIEHSRKAARISRRQRELISAVMRLNDQLPPGGPLARRLASHFLVELSPIS